jgi:hypothetical protein
MAEIVAGLSLPPSPRSRILGGMLELKPTCERCASALPPDSPDARICSYECTFCAPCADDELGGRCPNCGGVLERRPTRVG